MIKHINIIFFIYYNYCIFIPYNISLVNTLISPAYKYVVKRDDNIVAFFTILHEPNDEDELLLENLCIGTLNYFYKIFKLIIDYLNTNFNVKNYVINVDYIYFKYINKNHIFKNMNDLENYDDYICIKLDEKDLENIRKHVDFRMDKYGMDCNDDCVHNKNCNNTDECLDEIKCNCKDKYLYNDDNLTLYKDIIKFMHNIATLYFNKRSTCSFIFSKKCIHKKNFDNINDELELTINNKKGYDNILFPKTVTSSQIIAFNRKFYPIKMKIKREERMINIIGIVFNDPITFITDK